MTCLHGLPNITMFIVLVVVLQLNIHYILILLKGTTGFYIRVTSKLRRAIDSSPENMSGLK